MKKIFGDRDYKLMFDGKRYQVRMQADNSIVTEWPPHVCRWASHRVEYENLMFNEFATSILEGRVDGLLETEGIITREDWCDKKNRAGRESSQATSLHRCEESTGPRCSPFEALLEFMGSRDDAELKFCADTGGTGHRMWSVEYAGKRGWSISPKYAVDDLVRKLDLPCGK